MARPMDDIIAVNPEKELWKIEVKIIDLWTVFNKQQQDHYEMIFMDAKVISHIPRLLFFSFKVFV